MQSPDRASQTGGLTVVIPEEQFRVWLALYPRRTYVAQKYPEALHRVAHALWLRYGNETRAVGTREIAACMGITSNRVDQLLRKGVGMLAHDAVFPVVRESGQCPLDLFLTLAEHRLSELHDVEWSAALRLVAVPDACG